MTEKLEKDSTKNQDHRQKKAKQLIDSPQAEITGD